MFFTNIRKYARFGFLNIKIRQFEDSLKTHGTFKENPTKYHCVMK